MRQHPVVAKTGVFIGTERTDLGVHSAAIRVSLCGNFPSLFHETFPNYWDYWVGVSNSSANLYSVDPRGPRARPSFPAKFSGDIIHLET